MVFFCPKGGPLQNPYELLGIEHGASDDDIAKAFKKLMLQLHPDKQPPGQSAEEAEQVSQKFHDVMDAKSFLLDGEHLAARRAYDSKLVREKQQAAQANIFGAVPTTTSMPQPHPPTAPPSATNIPKKNVVDAPSSTQFHADATKQNSGAIGGGKSDFKGKSKTTAPQSQPKKNVNIKQWGKVHRTRTRPVTRRGETKSGSSGGDPMKHKTRTRARSAARVRNLDDSCGDFSTTDDGSCGSGEKHTYSNTAAHHDATAHKPCSNRPSVYRGAGRHQNRVAPRSPRDASRGNKQNWPPNPKIGGVGAAVGRERSSSHDYADKTRRKTDTSGGRKAYDSEKLSKSASIPASDANKTADFHPIGRRASDSDRPLKSNKPEEPMKTAADFSTFYPAVTSLEKQYHCPLTKEIMVEPMSDFEGNSYERVAILKYLETSTISPVTGNPLYAIHLSPNSALKEKIRYTLKLKECLTSLQNAVQPRPTLPSQPSSTLPPAKPQPREVKYKSLREAVDCFITDLNSGSPTVTIVPLDNSGITSFSYLGIKFRLEVPGGVSDNIIVQTWYEHSKKAAGISSYVVKFNAMFQKMGLGGKLTFRNMNRKYAFTLTQKMDPETFSKTNMRHCVEYFMEMSIKLHNIININDVRRVDKVRLTHSVAAGG